MTAAILGARDVRRAFGTKEVLKGATMSMDAGERVGLVGRNGSGKSTLIRILSGEDEPDEGEVVRRNGLRTGVLAQEPRFAAGATAVDAVLEGMADWVEAMRQYTDASEALESGTGEDICHTLEVLAGLRPAFKDDGRITAGNSSQISDGGTPRT